jgi:hypothetical protein
MLIRILIWIWGDSYRWTRFQIRNYIPCRAAALNTLRFLGEFRSWPNPVSATHGHQFFKNCINTKKNIFGCLAVISEKIWWRWCCYNCIIDHFLIHISLQNLLDKSCLWWHRTCPGRPPIDLTVHWIYANEEDQRHHDTYDKVCWRLPDLSPFIQKPNFASSHPWRSLLHKLLWAVLGCLSWIRIWNIFQSGSRTWLSDST